MRSAAGVSLILLGVLACSAPPEVDSADGTWVGTITTEGDVTTVINESGSVWGGTATLVEEASIGVDLGPDEYMLGNVEGVAVTEDRIFVLDRSVPVLRVYDLEGNHLLDMGRGGPGPGEFVNPYLLAASEDGRVFVRTFSGLVVFDFDGTHLMTLMERGGIVLPMVAGNDGTLFMPVAWPGPSAFGHLPIAPDGTRGERMQAPTLVDWEPWALIARAADGGYLQLSVPFSPSTVWTLAPSGAVIRASSDEYRIEVQDPAGKVLLIDRRADAVPVTDEERAWQEGVVSFRMKQVQPGWEWTANPIPASKPFFDRFYTDQDGVLWVRRILGTERMPDCDRDPLTAPEEGRPLRACFRDTIRIRCIRSGRSLPGASGDPVYQARGRPVDQRRHARAGGRRRSRHDHGEALPAGAAGGAVGGKLRSKRRGSEGLAAFSPAGGWYPLLPVGPWNRGGTVTNTARRETPRSTI